MLTKLDSYTKLIANLADKPTQTASELKAYYDSSPEEIRLAFNNLIDELAKVTDGSSGADNIGATAISTSPSTVQGILEWLHTQISDVVVGQIPDGSITSTKLSSDAKKAVNITVDDTAGHFTATEVEDVLAELFTNADNAQNNFATVVGSPALIGDTVEEITTVVQNAKNSMATNLTAKGQTSTGTEALQALADKIANVSTGKKWASGSATATSGRITVSGLGFKPSVIVANKSAGHGLSWSLSTDGTNYTFYDYTSNIAMGSLTIDGNTGNYVNNDGFSLNSFTSITGTVKWVAYE